ncbi:tyrosinase-like [Branchiostoma floridae]|uniref:Tyrosinase n=1 Tax=Branchiostoma floridae TaxID=7739 RepID=A0A9J7KIR3_BRAFL|nr:tyrosinase-like [Branchiostoma floridae]
MRPHCKTITLTRLSHVRHVSPWGIPLLSVKTNCQTVLTSLAFPAHCLFCSLNQLTLSCDRALVKFASSHSVRTKCGQKNHQSGKIFGIYSGIIMFLVVFFQLSFVVCYGQFPRACTDDLSLSTGRCCPLWPAADGTASPCGEALGRGTCRQIQPDDSPHSPSYPYVGVDDRERWPTVYWNWTCECRDNFYGIECSECKHGYTGQNCTERKVLIRRNIFDLSWWERTRFLRALDESKATVSERWVIPVTPYVNVLTNGSKPEFANVTTYDALVWMHYYVVRDVLLPEGGVFPSVDFAHEGPAFLPWHRLYLLLLERELAKIIGDENFALPYWDWRDLADCGDICTDDFFGASMQDGTGRLSRGSFLSDWKVGLFICLFVCLYVCLFAFTTK